MVEFISMLEFNYILLSMQLKNVQDKVNKEKVWVMKFEKERIKTGHNLFGDLFTAATNQKATLFKPTLTSIPSQVVVSPIRLPSNTKQSAGRQVGTPSLHWVLHRQIDGYPFITLGPSTDGWVPLHYTGSFYKQVGTPSLHWVLLQTGGYSFITLGPVQANRRVPFSTLGPAWTNR